MLITQEYKELNTKLHDSNKHYGANGHKWATHIEGFAKMVGTQDILDYGCGKSTLAQNLPFDINQYDPAILKHSVAPDPADIVVCTDVLEHIEPELIDNVLADIHRLTKEACFLVIANRPAKKILEDGRNAHLIQQDEKWWLEKLLPLFNLLQFSSNGVGNNTEYLIVAKPRV
jgi:2-polyprenyl-3-methyl-5-hydroxy-6-metoxy-1,4-benzoquinol methylase